MDDRALAVALLDAEETERIRLLHDHNARARPGLAGTLKALYDEAKTSDPARAAACAAALRVLAAHTPTAEVQAYADWVDGMAALQLRGEAEKALTLLSAAILGFEALNQASLAATVQVSKVYALAITGDYDEAIACGLRARNTLLSSGDLLTVGKIEQNLGNIYWRRDLYQEADTFYQAAFNRFIAVNNQRELINVEVNRANVQTSLYNFDTAASLYKQALMRAQTMGAEVTQADIEVNLGWLFLFQGQYDKSLQFLEQSRRRYATLAMLHEAAVAELELADAYLELNLIPEAADIYRRVSNVFAGLGMKAEQARTLANEARAHLLLGRFDSAEALIIQSRRLYQHEANSVGVATVALIQAQLHYANENFAAAERAAAESEQAFFTKGAIGKALHARWLHGESVRVQTRYEEAKQLLQTTLDQAEQQALPQIAYRCYTSLGLIARDTNETERAESLLQRAAALIESLRAPLPGEEFRTAFVADKLTPYTELIRLCLQEGSGESTIEAWDYVERARSRALFDVLDGSVQYQQHPRDAFEADLFAKLSALTQQLSWLYTQINRPTADQAERSSQDTQHLQNEVYEREAQVRELNRQLQQRGASTATQARLAPLKDIQRDLGDDTVLVEYFSLDGELLAFVVSNQGVRVERNLGREADVEAAIQQFFFQINALRYGAGRVEAHVAQLQRRAQHYLGVLYGMLLQPLQADLGERRLVVSPYRMLHYVPFHALYDGERYIIEQREVSYTPSANVLHHCLSLEQRPIRQALLLGVADDQAPQVRDELHVLADVFPSSTVLADVEATLTALQEHAPRADVLHLASHGQFRPDNPLFSALKLHDAWLTVRDAYKLQLRCRLVALSACETGVNAVAPGDELLGLARGFFAAGSAALLASLWSVDDSATTTLMIEFYTHLQAGENPAAALRHAQLHVLHGRKHPFFWSPFVLIGRW